MNFQASNSIHISKFLRLEAKVPSAYLKLIEDKLTWEKDLKRAGRGKGRKIKNNIRS